MKNYIIYASLLVVGLAAGYFLFGTKGTSQEEEKTHDHSEHSEQIWTCSMHPQIRQPEPGDCPICGMDLIPLEENANEDPLVFTMSEEAVKISNIQTTKIGASNTSEKGLAISERSKQMKLYLRA